MTQPSSMSKQPFVLVVFLKSKTAMGMWLTSLCQRNAETNTPGLFSSLPASFVDVTRLFYNYATALCMSVDLLGRLNNLQCPTDV